MSLLRYLGKAAALCTHISTMRPWLKMQVTQFLFLSFSPACVEQLWVFNELLEFLSPFPQVALLSFFLLDSNPWAKSVCLYNNLAACSSEIILNEAENLRCRFGNWILAIGWNLKVSDFSSNSYLGFKPIWCNLFWGNHKSLSIVRNAILTNALYLEVNLSDFKPIFNRHLAG